MLFPSLMIFEFLWTSRWRGFYCVHDPQVIIVLLLWLLSRLIIGVFVLSKLIQSLFFRGSQTQISIGRKWIWLIYHALSYSSVLNWHAFRLLAHGAGWSLRWYLRQNFGSYQRFRRHSKLTQLHSWLHETGSFTTELCGIRVESVMILQPPDVLACIRFLDSFPQCLYFWLSELFASFPGIWASLSCHILVLQFVSGNLAISVSICYLVIV